MRTTHAGLDQFVRKRHVGARLSNLVAEIVSYPVKFEVAKTLKVVPALGLDPVPAEEGVVLKRFASHARTRVYHGTPLVVYCDGGDDSSIGFVVYDPTG